MENHNNIGNTADYDGYGISGNGIDKTKNDLTTEDFEQKDAPVSTSQEERGANARAIGEEIDRRNSERGAAAVAASEAREVALNVSYDEKAALEEAHEKDPTNEKIIAYLKQVNEYIAKLIRELDQPPENINTISSRQADNMASAQQTIDSRPGTVESADNPVGAEDNDLAYLGKDNIVYSNPQDARDSFAA